MSNSTYSVAALAAALNVPRTTVNDWLAKYEDFIDATAIGKRKVYSERTLTVLKEVARLRDMGKTGTEIEEALEQIMGITPEIAPEKPVGASAADPVAEDQAGVPPADDSAQLPAVKKFEENAMELAAFIAELRKEQVQSRKRSRFTAFMLLAVIIVLVAALGASIKALRMQFAERKLEAARTQQTLEKLNKEFTCELKSMENLRQQERRAAEKNTMMLKGELSRLQKANAEELKRFSSRLAADREAMQKKLALQEKILKHQSEAERKHLLMKMEKIEKDAAMSQMVLRKELVDANRKLYELNKKLEKPLPPPPQPEPAVIPAEPAAAPAAPTAAPDAGAAEK